MHVQAFYDPLLVAISILVAVFASYVALSLAYTVNQSRGRARALWLAGGALAMGFGIWSMHFVGMLAFVMPGMEMAYDVPLMVLSVVIAIAASALALFVVSRVRVPPRSVMLAGIFMAAAIAGMHYTGMYSMRMPATIEWNPWLVALSIAIALIASLAALAISLRLRNRPRRFFQMSAAAIVMGIAISGMHYTGMFAATFHHTGEKIENSQNLLVSDGLSVAVVSMTLMILTLALAGSMGQSWFTQLRRTTQDTLKSSEDRFRMLVDAVKDYAIFMLDREGRITTWNPGAERITGYQAAEVIGKHVSILANQFEKEQHATAKELRIAAETGHFETEVERVRKDGTKFWANIVLSPLFGARGEITGYSKVTRDVTQLHEYEMQLLKSNEQLELRVTERTEELQRRENQLRSITNALPVLLGQLDRNERILFANEALATWLGKSVDGMIGLKFKDALGDDRYPHNEKYIANVLRGETVTYERRSQSAEGKSAVLSITYVPEFAANGSGEVEGFILVASEVTKYKEIEAELKQARDAAQQANEYKTQFLANMSHEIRTPIGAITGFVSLLKNPALVEEERQNSILIIERNSQHLLRLIDDILDLSKVEAGKITIDNVKFSFPEFLAEFQAVQKLKSDDKGIEFVVRVPEKIPDLICTDPVRLRQILSNLAGNAIKFTEKGKVEVLVRYQSPFLEFSVKDTGIGLTEDQAGRLFQPFMQADPTTTRRFGGTGLGLILAKRLSESLGGDLALKQSVYGVGSEFVARIKPIPVEQTKMVGARDLNAGRRGLVASESKLNLDPLKILVVEDSPDNRMLISMYLDKTGAQLEMARDGVEGVERALEGKFDLILMDLQMPRMDGNEATRALRKAGFAKPIVALTAHAMREEREKAFISGCTEYLTKPIDRSRLIQVLERYVPEQFS